MSLRLLRVQDWNARFSYAPPLKDVVINTDNMIGAEECASRGEGPWMSITMVGGKSFVAQGAPADLLSDNLRR